MSKLKFEVDGKIAWEGECKDGAYVHLYENLPSAGIVSESVSPDVIVDRHSQTDDIWGVEILARADD